MKKNLFTLIEFISACVSASLVLVLVVVPFWNSYACIDFERNTNIFFRNISIVGETLFVVVFNVFFETSLILASKQKVNNFDLLS